MSEVATTNTVEAIVEYPARLQMSMLAPVRRIAELIPAGDKEARIIGYVFGEARGVSFRANQNSTDGESAAALIGVFEGTPSYADMPGMTEEEKCAHRPRLASGVCFLPTQAQEVIVKNVLSNDQEARPTNLKRGQRSDKLGVVVPVSVEVAIRKSDSPVGYEWVVRGLANVSAVSPVERMRQLMGTGPGARLELLVDKADGTTERTTSQAQLPAPGKSGKDAKPTPAKGRGKR
jgi:hypothetical protein